MKDKLLSFECEKQQVKYDVREENFFMLTSILAPELDEDAGDERQPIDLVCVIDRSGSMAGSRMKLTKKALDFLVQEMQEKDRIGIILFDNDVDIFYPLTTCTAENKAEIRKDIQNISAQGSTNLSGGLFTGLEQLRKREIKNQVSSVLLFTDGEANVGLKESKSIIDMIHGRITHPPMHVRSGKEKESLLQTYLRRKKAKKNVKKQQPKMPQNPNFAPVQDRVQIPVIPQPVVPQPIVPHNHPMLSRTEMISSPNPPIIHSRSEMPMPRTEMISNPNPPNVYSRSQMPMPRTEMMMPPRPPVVLKKKRVAPPRRKSPPKNKTPDYSHLGPGFNFMAEGISLYTFGFGNSHNEKLLKDLSEASSGIYYWLKTSEDIAESFIDCLGGLLSIVCKDLRIEFKPVNGVRIKKIHTVYNQLPLPNGGRAVLVPDLQSEEKRDLLVEVEIPNLSEPELRWKALNVKLSYKDKESNSKSEELTGVLMRVEDEPEQQIKNEKISEQKNRVYVTEVMDDVRRLADGNKFGEAKKKCEEAMKKVENSVSGKNVFCKALVKDLGSQIQGMNASSYSNSGERKRWVCMQQGLQRQRVADLQSPSNMLFANKKRANLKSKFRRGKY